MSKTILVTGASRGLGHTITRLLLSAPHNANVVLLSRTLAPLESLSNEFPNKVAYISGTITDATARKDVVKLAKEKFGGLDGIVVNHGVLDPVGKLVDADVEKWKEAFDINVLGVVGLLKEAIPLLRESEGGGKVVFISSGAAVGAYQGWGAYGGSKAALHHLALTLSVEEPTITSISLRPGVIATQMQEDIREKHAEAMGEHHKRFIQLKESGSLLRPEQPGSVAANLVMNAEHSLTGKFINWNDESLAKYQGTE